VRWITEALQTVKSKTLEQITVRLDSNDFPHKISESYRQQWHGLDRLLVQFWASHSIRPKVTYEAGGIAYGVGARKMDIRHYASGLLLELTQRGLVDLVGCGR